MYHQFHLKGLWMTLLVVTTIFSCKNTAPELEGIDLAAWKNDKNACIGNRIEMIDAIKNQKDELLGLEEMEIVKLLGRPDANELYKRNQKFYHYFLEPSSLCNDGKKEPITLTIRFNAMGLAKEVAVQ